MAAVTQRTVTTPDGRTLAIEEAGDPAGRPVLVHNGTPNSRHIFAKLETEHEGLAPGSQGWWDDGVAHASPWGFELSAIREVHAWLAERS